MFHALYIRFFYLMPCMCFMYLDMIFSTRLSYVYVVITHAVELTDATTTIVVSILF